MDDEINVSRSEKVTRRRKQKRSLIESRSPAKRAKGRAILLRTWVENHSILLFFIITLVCLLAFLVTQYLGQEFQYQPPEEFIQSSEP